MRDAIAALNPSGLNENWRVSIVLLFGRRFPCLNNSMLRFQNQNKLRLYKHVISISYFAHEHAIEVEAIGAEVDVEDDGIARAILTLDQPKRDIILLSYFLGRSDSAIGALTGMPRSTVQHHRASALRLLRDVLAGEVESE